MEFAKLPSKREQMNSNVPGQIGQNMIERPQEEALHLREYLQIVRKRLWLILAIVIIAVAHTSVTSMRVKPVYRATAQILIERYNPQVVKVEEVYALDAYTVDYYPTQHKLLRSRALAREVIRKLELDRHATFNSKPRKKWFRFSVRKAVASMVRAVIPRKRSAEESGTPEEDKDPLTPYINAYLGMLRIEPVEESRLVNISFQGPEPGLVARMANAHAEVYIDRDLEMKLGAAEEAVGWLGGRLDELKMKLRESEEALQRFQEQEDIVALESVLSGSGGSDENILAQKMAELSSSITAVRTERIGLETLHLQLQELSKKPGMAESIPQVIQNPLIQSLKAEHISLSQQYSELRTKYGEKHPRIVALGREIQNLRSRIRNEVKKISKSVEIQYKMLMAKEESLQKELHEAKQEILGLNKKAIQYGVLKREVESNRQM
jgi:succinoglycan biosynthesis transport protein ExoP